MRKSRGAEKPEEVTEYPTKRPMEMENAEMTVNIDLLNVELRCPICLEIMSDPVATACLHRFCASCIEKCLRVGKQECPTCRRPVATRRSLRKDTNFALLVATLYPDLQSFTAEEHALSEALSQSHRTQHAEQMRVLWAKRRKLQHLAQEATRPAVFEVEPRKDASSEGTEGGSGESAGSASEGEEAGEENAGKQEEGEQEEGDAEGKEEAEVEGEGGEEEAEEAEGAAGPSRAARPGAREPTAREPPTAPRPSAPALIGSGSRPTGQRRKSTTPSALRPRRHELGFLLHRHPLETSLPALPKAYVTVARAAQVKQLQKFLAWKLQNVVAWHEFEVSTRSSAGLSVVLKTNITLGEAVVEHDLDPDAIQFHYRRRF